MVYLRVILVSTIDARKLLLHHTTTTAQSIELSSHYFTEIIFNALK
jgi:hypothetical protein